MGPGHSPGKFTASEMDGNAPNFNDHDEIVHELHEFIIVLVA
jgi:hypothetical protein